MLHVAPTAGNFGVLRILHRVRLRFYWPYKKRDIIKSGQECAICQINNSVEKHPNAQMRQYSVGVPMERLKMDIFGPLARTIYTCC